LTTKSADHLRLEQEIKETKESIYRLPSNSSTIEGLRKQAIDLIKKLTYEIRREFFEEQKLREFN
jgi:hypothetical protein